MRRSVRPAKSDRNIKLPAGHGQHVRRVVHHLIERDQGKAERHELDDRPETDHRRADAHSGKSVLADRRIDHSIRTKTIEQTLADLVGAVIFRHFLAHQENVRIALQLFRQRFVQGLSVSDFAHVHGPIDRPGLFAPSSDSGDIRVVVKLLQRRLRAFLGKFHARNRRFLGPLVHLLKIFVG